MRRVVRKPQGTEARKPRIRIRWQYVVLSLLMVLFAIKFVQKTQELRAVNAEATALRVANQQTIRDNARLTRAIRYEKTPRYIQEQARAMLGDTMPGEISIKVHPSYRHVVAVRRAPARYVDPQPTWQQWWRSFFG